MDTNWLPLYCPFTFGGFYQLAPTVTAGRAEYICNLLNMTLAQVTDSNAMYALQVLEKCQVERAWIGSFNGLSVFPAMSLSQSIGAILDINYPVLSRLEDSVLCQEPVIVESVKTTTTTFTTSFGTVTDCVRITKTPECCDEKAAMAGCHNQAEFKDDAICPSCSGLCKIPDTPFAIVKQRVPLNQAAKYCHSYNMSLADLMDGNLEKVESGIDGCTLEPLRSGPVTEPLVIRSFNGVDGAVYVLLVPNEHAIIYGLKRPIPDFEKGYPLCQCAKPIVTGQGPRVLPTTTVTSTSVITIPHVYPETTKTLTQTVIRSLRKPGHECRED